MVKIAICMSGYLDHYKRGPLRTKEMLDKYGTVGTNLLIDEDFKKKHPKIGYDALKRIMEENDVDFFIHSWEVDNKDLINEIYKPKKYIYEKQVNFGMELKDYGVETDNLNIKDWNPFHIDFVNSIDRNAKIIGIGHSIGGNILLKSAMLNPDKFEKIILLDPTFFPPFTIYAWRMISFFKMQSYFLAYIKTAENKKMQYNSIEDMFKSYRRHKVFSRFSDKDLLSFVNSLTFEKDGKINLIFDNKWDAAIYKTELVNDMFNWDNISKLSTKTLIIRAEHSDFFYNKTSNIKGLIILLWVHETQFNIEIFNTY